MLLDLDANLLKELDIVAFGKRMRIANAIHELNRPPSIVSSENSGRANGNTAAHPRQSTSSSLGASGPSPLITTLLSPESPPHSGDIAVTPDRRSRPNSEPGSAPEPSASTNDSVVGLGFNSPDRAGARGRPAMLDLSPSDSALKARAALADQILEDLHEGQGEDAREVMSEVRRSLARSAAWADARRRARQPRRWRSARTTAAKAATCLTLPCLP